MEEGRVVIIPDEGQIEDEIFDEPIKDDDSHVLRYQDFSNKYNLGYTFKENDSLVVPFTISSLGHFCINTAYNISTILFYVPELVTKRQYNYFIGMKEEILKYDEIIVELLGDDNKKRKIKDYDILLKEIKIRYERYKENKEERKHVK